MTRETILTVCALFCVFIFAADTSVKAIEKAAYDAVHGQPE